VAALRALASRARPAVQVAIERWQTFTGQRAVKVNG
jgi:hypothetical protein